MIGQLLGPITNIIGGIVQGKVEQKAAETKAKVAKAEAQAQIMLSQACLLYTSPSPRDRQKSRMPSSA